MRITKDVLRAKVNNINTALELGDNEKFVLSWAYGGVALEKKTNSMGGTKRISDRTNNANMAMILDAIENTIYATMR
jgi:hypothetical protein